MITKIDGDTLLGVFEFQNPKELAFTVENTGRIIIPRDSIVSVEPYIQHIVIKHDGTEFIGKIISQDAREVLIDTKSIGKVIIPKHEIKEIRVLKDEDVNYAGIYIPKEIFSTRYFFTTNGLPVEKGESYTQWNLFGPDFQFSAGNNLGLGVMTSWFGVPIIGSAKYTFKLGKNSGLAIGTLLGTGSWAAPDFGLALPYSTLTFGDRRSNISFSAGYGAVWVDSDSDGRMLLSVAAMSKVGPKISLVFDSFIVPDAFSVLIPGIRWQIKSEQAFQFGFAGLITNGELVPLPIPMLQWFRKIGN